MFDLLYVAVEAMFVASAWGFVALCARVKEDKPR